MTPAELKDSLLTGAPLKRKRNPPKNYNIRQVKTPKARTNIEWRLKGVYGNQQEVAEIARQNKVSRRKTDELLSGSKITYRCNAWKRTRCNFQMYALYTKDNKIFLYEGGEHDHTGIRVPNIAGSPERDDSYPELSVMNPNGPHELGMVKNEPCSNQMCHSAPDQKFESYLNPPTNVPGGFNMSEFLEEDDPYIDTKCNDLRMPQNFAVRNLINNKNHMQMMEPRQEQIELTAPKEESIEVQKPPTPQSPPKPVPMNYPTPLISKTPVMLSMQQPLLQPVLQQDPSRNLPQHYLNFISGRADLLQIAADYNLLFQYTSDQEMVFVNHSKNQSLTIRNSGDPATVQLLHGNNVAQTYAFSQSNWPSFIWGIRGLCLHFFFPNDVGRVGRADDTGMDDVNIIK